MKNAHVNFPRSPPLRRGGKEKKERESGVRVWENFPFGLEVVCKGKGPLKGTLKFWSQDPGKRNLHLPLSVILSSNRGLLLLHGGEMSGEAESVKLIVKQASLPFLLKTTTAAAICTRDDDFDPSRRQ